jgi:pimeloyl-ACP methyl ester carboxylesterase
VPQLTRKEVVELHWEARGEGPLVVICPHFFAYPEVWTDLVSQLATDHRVITYDARGTGRSTRHGPYDVATDAADLAAIIAQEGGPAVPICFGDAAFRAFRLAYEQPSMVPAVVLTGGNPLLSERAFPEQSEALGGSHSVNTAILQMMESDYRGALRSFVASTSPQLSEEDTRERVRRTADHVTQEAAIERMRTLFEDHPDRDLARKLGSRVWFLHFSTLWAPGDTVAAARELLPEAHVEAMEEGPISRPDILAGAVRRVTASMRPGQG